MANCGRMVRDRAMVTKESLYMQLYSSNDSSRNKKIIDILIKQIVRKHHNTDNSYMTVNSLDAVTKERRIYCIS